MNDKSPLRAAFKIVAVVLPACVAPVAMGQANPPADSAHATALQACPKVTQEIVDLNVLADGLKNSNAVGLFEKVRLKSAIDELIGRMKAFHGGARSYTLAQLQEQYDVLMMRIASQLQDKDLQLHGQLCNAWDSIWSQLADRGRFTANFS
jgi:hypothetical protein